MGKEIVTSAPTQPFPKDGVLASNLNWSLGRLRQRIGEGREAAYSYVVKSIKLKRGSTVFEQSGSAPNFQGGVLTLCTCKHQMRATMDCSGWEGKWIVGFTSRCRNERPHWLFYLAQIANAYESQAELWKKLSASVRRAKSTRANFLGDLFVPQGELVGDDRFDPRCYVTPPHHSHRKNKCHNGWHNDIKYKHFDRHQHRPALLVGDRDLTFLWDRPLIFLDQDHPRDFRKWESLGELLPHLKPEAS